MERVLIHNNFDVIKLFRSYLHEMQFPLTDPALSYLPFSASADGSKGQQERENLSAFSIMVRKLPFSIP